MNSIHSPNLFVIYVTLSYILFSMGATGFGEFLLGFCVGSAALCLLNFIFSLFE
jgi:hypothetical protein